MTKGIQETNVTFTAKQGVTKEDDSWKIKTKKEQKATLSLDEDTSGKERILYLQFDVENGHPNRDVSIVINGIRNKLTAKSHLYYNDNTTFTYVMKLSADQEKIKVTFGAGTYRICNLKSYVSDTTVLEDASLYQSTFTPDRNATKGSQISGEQSGRERGRDGDSQYGVSGLPDGKRGALGDDHLPRPGTFHGKMDQPAGGLFVWSDVFSDGEMKKKQRKRQMKKLQNMPLV